MKKLVCCIVVLCMLIAFVSCMDNKQAKMLFERVEAVMDEHPDSALAMLDSVKKESEAYPRSQKMRYELLHAKAQNKAYVDFTSDSIMKDVVEYYDDHGTPNEQIEAHYLLGCVYRDLNEAPMALSCYLDATEKADTMSDDCDYGALMRVWGQIAEEYDKQCMPLKELEALEKYRYYAKKDSNIFDYILGSELRWRAYHMIGDTTRVINCVTNACEHFKKHGYISNAASSLSIIIPFYIQQGKIIKAKDMMEYYEKYSGKYDYKCDSAIGNVIYYNTKGLYCQYVNQYDSAEFFYRKLLKSGNQYLAYNGLFDVFVKRMIQDSIAKYKELVVQAFDYEFTDLHTQAMFNAEGMFNYSRNQRLAMEKEHEAAQNKYNAIFIAAISFVAICIFLYVFCKFKAKNKKEFMLLAAKFALSNEAYKKAMDDYALMETDFKQYKNKKAIEIEQLQIQWENIAKQYESKKKDNNMNALKSFFVIVNIRQRYEKVKPGCQATITDREWQSIYDKVKDLLPRFYLEVLTDNQLSAQERKIAVLTLIGESTSSIAIMLNSSPASVSNAKTSINSKLFSDNTARTLFYNLYNIEY